MSVWIDFCDVLVDSRYKLVRHAMILDARLGRRFHPLYPSLLVFLYDKTCFLLMFFKRKLYYLFGQRKMRKLYEITTP